MTLAQYGVTTITPVSVGRHTQRGWVNDPRLHSCYVIEPRLESGESLGAQLLSLPALGKVCRRLSCSGHLRGRKGDRGSGRVQLACGHPCLGRAAPGTWVSRLPPLGPLGPQSRGYFTDTPSCTTPAT